MHCEKNIKLNDLNPFLKSTKFSVTISFHLPLTQMKGSEHEKHKGWIKYFFAFPYLIKEKYTAFMSKWEWWFSALRKHWAHRSELHISVTFEQNPGMTWSPNTLWHISWTHFSVLPKIFMLASVKQWLDQAENKNQTLKINTYIKNR